MRSVWFVAAILVALAVVCTAETSPREVLATTSGIKCGELLKKAKSARIVTPYSSSSATLPFEKPKNHNPLIIGLCVGIGGAALIAGIAAIVIVAVMKKKKDNKAVQMSSVTSGGAAPIYDS